MFSYVIISQMFVQLMNFQYVSPLLGCFGKRHMNPTPTWIYCGAPKIKLYFIIISHIHLVLWFRVKNHLLHAPAVTVNVEASVMQCAAVRTNMSVRRVPPQRRFAYDLTVSKICHGLEWVGFSGSPPAIRSGAKGKYNISIFKTYVI